MHTCNSFIVRTIHSNKAITGDNSMVSLSIEPSIVQFNNYPSSKISISKLIVRNNSKTFKKISLSQPSKTYFEVKLKDKEISARQTTEVYVVFNPQREKTRIQDEFLIKVEGESTIIHIPIVCQYRQPLNSKLSSSKQLISSKQNEQIEPVQRMSTLKIKRTYFSRNRQISIQKRQSRYNELKNFVVTSFLERYQRICCYIEEKKVKNEVYLGQKLLTSELKKEICEYSQRVQEMQQRTIFKAVFYRFNVEYREDGPVIQIPSGVILSWDPKKNQSGLIFEKGVSKIQDQVRKHVVSLRFEKIKHYLKIFKQYSEKQQTLGKSLRVGQYLDYLDNKFLNSKDTIQLQFDFDKSSLKHQQIVVDTFQTPVEQLYRERNVHFDIVQRIGFDNWIPMNILKQNYQQIYQFHHHQGPQYYLHLPKTVRDNRKGAHWQLPFREEDMSLGTIQELNHNFQSYFNGTELFSHPVNQLFGDRNQDVNEPVPPWVQDYFLRL